MAGLDPAIHVFLPASQNKAWITGSSPVMTIADVDAASINSSSDPPFQTARAWACPIAQMTCVIAPVVVTARGRPKLFHRLALK
jgi:hypothetical protein